MTLVEPRWDEARAALAEAVRPLAPVRHVLAVCDGLVLAEDLVALCALPSFDTSAMDGWAVCGPGPWTVVGAVPGRAPGARSADLGAGRRDRDRRGGARRGRMRWSAARTARSRLRGGAEVLSAPDPDGPTHVRPAGEECAEGEVLAPAGTVLNPALIGLAAACGPRRAPGGSRPSGRAGAVRRRAGHGGRPRPGLVRDSLGPQVPAWVARMGADVVLVRALRGHPRRARRGDPSCGRGCRCGADHRGDGGGPGRPPARGDRAVRAARWSSTASRCARATRCWRPRWIAVAPGWSGSRGTRRARS